MQPDPRELVERLNALAEKATPGPWHWQWEGDSVMALYGPKDDFDHVLWCGICPSCQKHGQRCTAPNDANADFIAALRNEYPALRAAVLRVAELDAALREIRHANIGWMDCIRIADAALTAPQGEERGT